MKRNSPTWIWVLQLGRIKAFTQSSVPGWELASATCLKLQSTWTAAGNLAAMQYASVPEGLEGSLWKSALPRWKYLICLCHACRLGRSPQTGGAVGPHSAWMHPKGNLTWHPTWFGRTKWSLPFPYLFIFLVDCIIWPSRKSLQEVTQLK